MAKNKNKNIYTRIYDIMLLLTKYIAVNGNIRLHRSFMSIHGDFYKDFVCKIVINLFK